MSVASAGFGALREEHRSPVIGRRWLVCIALAIGFFTSAQAFAAPLSFRGKMFSHTASKQPLGELLTGFAASQGWVITLPANLDTAVNAQFTLSPRDFWELMTRTHGLQWYFDGTAVHVSHNTDVRSTVYTITPLAYERLMAALDRLQVSDARFPVRYDSESGAAIVSGPPRFLELVESVYTRVENAEDSADAYRSRVFALNAANAADTVVRVGAAEVKVDGVATILRRIMGIPAVAPESSPRMSDPSVELLRRMGAARSSTRNDVARAVQGDYRTPAIDDSDARGPRAQGEFQDARPSWRGQARPRVEADAATNVVIVRDLPSRMQEYATLIQRLDRPRSLIEIEAHTVEVEQGALSELGVDWQARRDGRGVFVSNLPGAQVETPASVPQFSGYLTALVGNSAMEFLARVRALEANGRARISTSPRILTLENSEALIENSETAYVRVAANLDASLYAVSTGSQLRVRPTVTSHAGERRIKLLVNLEDGVFTSQSVDQVPTVQRNRVFTQAELVNGAALLIGGLSDNREREVRSEVPVLSKLPLVGGLFRYSSTSSARKERVYMLTPRLIELKAATTEAPASASSGRSALVN